MIKAVLIDDERPALRELEFLLKDYPEISVTGMFTNPLEAIEEMEHLKPQVVFLDINMPCLRGIDAASRILDGNPDTDIIFVTAYDQYAIEAFELHALDYILKPISKARLEKTVERVIKKKPIGGRNNSQRLQIKCFGRFKVGWEEEEPIKWRAEKTKELFAFLLHNEGREMSKDELLDKLWDEDEPEKAIRQLYNGIYYIRKALEEYGIDKSLINIGSNYCLKLGTVDLDTARFCRYVKSSGGTLEELEEIESLYTGDYLEGEDYPWADFERERLTGLYQQVLIRLSEKYIEKKQLDKAVTALIKAYNKNPYEENITELLLKLYIEIDEKNKAAAHYMAYSKLINEELGIKPHEKLQKLYQSIK